MKRLKDLKRKGGSPAAGQEEASSAGDSELDALFKDLEDEEENEGGLPGDSNEEGDDALADLGGGGDPLGGAGGFSSMGGGAGASDEEVGEIKQSLRKVEVMIDSVKNEMTKVGERQGNAEKNIEDLLMIYELVAKQFNPFATNEEAGDVVGLSEDATETGDLPGAATLTANGSADSDELLAGTPDESQSADSMNGSAGSSDASHPSGSGGPGQDKAMGAGSTPTDPAGRPAPGGVDQYGRPIPPKTDAFGRTLPGAVDQHGRPLVETIDELGRPVKVAVDQQGRPISTQGTERSRQAPGGFDEYGRPIPGGVDEYGRPLPPRVDEYGMPIPGAVDEYGRPLPARMDEYGRPIPGMPSSRDSELTGPDGIEYDRFGRPVRFPMQGAAEQRSALPRIEIEGRWKVRPILNRINNDYASVVLALRWIEFLFERVKRNNISSLLDYYEDIGWISNEVKSNIMAYARGAVQDISAYDPELEEETFENLPMAGDNQILDDKGRVAHRKFRRIDEWKLSAEDHLKSLLFIKKMGGARIDKDELNSLEQEVKVMKYSLRRFHEV